MATQIHAFGPNGELSPGAAAALAGLGDIDGEIVTTTATDRNLHPFTTTADAADFRSDNTSTGAMTAGTDDGTYMRTTATVTEASTSVYYGTRFLHRQFFTAAAYPFVWVTAEVRTSAATSVRFHVTWLTGEATPDPAGTSGPLSVTPGSWVRVTAMFPVPAGADNYRAHVRAFGPFTTGDTLDVRNWGVITSDRGYFDGDTPDTTDTMQDRSHVWDGTAGASMSTRTITTRTFVGGLNGRTIVQAIADLDADVADLQAAGGGATPQTGALVQPPVDFPGLRRTDGITVHRDGTGYTTDVETLVASLRPPTGVTYYVSPTGGGDGSSPASPTLLRHARDAADVGTIVFAPGEYRRNQSALATGSTTKSINYIAGGPGVRLTGWNADLSWSLVSGSVYSATRSSVTHIGDPRPQHWTDGVMPMYAKQAGTDATAVTGPGQWATDGSTVWVWALGNANLATDPGAIRLGIASWIGVQHTGGTAYVENITIEGAMNNSGMYMRNGTLLMVDCTVQGSADDGVTALDALSIAVRTDASGNGMDGFNYHEGTGGICDFIEVDCIARRNGWTKSGNNNGSTAHETVHGIRVGGRYSDSHGPLVVDVGTSQTWNVGATTERTDPDMLANSTGHFHADGAGARMWVQDATATGLGAAWVTSNGATLALRNPRRVDTEDVALISGGGTLTRY